MNFLYAEGQFGKTARHPPSSFLGTEWYIISETTSEAWFTITFMKANFFLEPTITVLEEFRRRLEELAEKWQLSPRMVHIVELIVEELHTNYIKYACTGIDTPAQVLLEKLDPKLLITYTYSGPPFNPLLEEPPDHLSLPVEQREAGGLGLHLINHFADDIVYSRKNNQNILRLTIVS